MTHFDLLLWDVDGTLLDFKAAEAAAIRALFVRYGLGPCPDDMLARYSAINQTYWKRLERGELTRPQILVGRFEEFFRREGLDGPDPAAFNEDYQQALGETVVYRDQSLELVAALKGKIPQYAASNGTVVAQEKKLRLSGFDKLLDGVFLSERLGAEKPAREFFDRAFREIGAVDRDRTLIVGDSLTSDILGGNRAGIRTCWYDPDGAPNDTDARPDFVIRDLNQVWDLL